MKSIIKCKLCVDGAYLHGNQHISWLREHTRKKHEIEWAALEIMEKEIQELKHKIKEKFGHISHGF